MTSRSRKSRARPLASMISSEASASELAISSAITLAPYRHASPDETHSSDAPPVCAPALAKGPPRCYEASASRSDRMRDTHHKFFLRPTPQILLQPLVYY